MSMRVQRFEDLPGLSFDVRKNGLIETAWCLKCGHRFVPQTPMNPKAAWTATQGTKHMVQGCQSTGGGASTVLTPPA